MNLPANYDAWKLASPYDDEDEECDHCGGTGFDGHECGEDTCCCLDPEENVECSYCEGEGYISRSEERQRAADRYADECYDRYKDEK